MNIQVITTMLLQYSCCHKGIDTGLEQYSCYEGME